MNYKNLVYEKIQTVEKIISIAKTNNFKCFKNLLEIKEQWFFLNANDSNNESAFIDLFYRLNNELLAFETEYVILSFNTNYYRKCKLFCSIIAGNGGNDATDICYNMFNLYKLYFNQIGCLKSFNQEKLTLEINNVYFFCKMLMVDNLVYKIIRISPFCNKKQTSSVKVHFYEVCYVNYCENFKQNEIVVSVCKSSGAGGQHVNTTESKVKITHKHTGISVVCSQTRSQIQNKNIAIKYLREKINKMYELRKMIEKKQNYTSFFKISWFNFDRIINLHREGFVKDNNYNFKLKIKNFEDINLFKIHNQCFYSIIFSLK